jgi:hypothetical protein
VESRQDVLLTKSTFQGPVGLRLPNALHAMSVIFFHRGWLMDALGHCPELAGLSAIPCSKACACCMPCQCERPLCVQYILVSLLGLLGLKTATCPLHVPSCLASAALA